VVVALAVLGACGDDDPGPDEASVPETTVPVAERPPGTTDACELLSAEEVEDVTGVAVHVPEATGISICQWEPVDAVEGAMLVSLGLLPYEGAAEPESVCAQTAAAVGDVEELDWFDAPAFSSMSGEGALRTLQVAVCPDPAVLIVTVVGGDSDDDRLDAAFDLAVLALPRL
jgi:hypothetical protein